MFGMPAQSIAIVMTFWTFVFWLWLERTPAADGAGAAATWPQDELAHRRRGVDRRSCRHDDRRMRSAISVRATARSGSTGITDTVTDDSDGTDLEPDPGGNPDRPPMDACRSRWR